MEDGGPFRLENQGGLQEEVALMLDLEGQVRLGWAGVEFSDCLGI